jgi:multiple sugar transport system substrate-binding protein
MVSKKTNYVRAALWSAALILLAGCGRDQAEEAAVAPALPYAGQTVMVVAPKLNAALISGPILEEAERFEKLTGAKVRVVTPGWGETVARIRESLSGAAPPFDVFVITASWSGPLFAADTLAEVPEAIRAQVGWDDILPIYRQNLLTWNGRPYALPYDGDVVTLYYRLDLFDNPEYRERFKARYGYPLAPPATWSQYDDIATFFQGWDWDKDGENEYGIAGNRLVNGSAMLIFLARAAAYAKHPDDPAYYFDPDTMRARIADPGFVRALEDDVRSLSLGPPGMVNFAGNDVRTWFVRGNVAMAIDWANIGIDAAGSPVSVVRDKVGYAQLPGADRVYDARARRWDVRRNAASAMVGNYIFLVNRKSAHQDAAFAFAAHMTSRAMTQRLTVTPGTGVNPSRASHLEDAAAWQANGFSPESARAYLDTLRVALSNPNHIFDLRIPGSDRYYRALDQALHAALTGELKPQKALAQAAKEWEQITDELGRDLQGGLYRASLSPKGG